MSSMNSAEPEVDLETQQILLAASNHDVETLQKSLRTGSANVQDPETGFTPLHATIAACEPSLTSSQTDTSAENIVTNKIIHGFEHSQSPNGTNGQVSHGEHADRLVLHNEQFELEAAVGTVRLLLQNGAIWNDLSNENETPGCIARRLGLEELYEIMVDAGVRAEMLLNRLDGYERLEDDSEGEVEEQDQVSVELATPLAIPDKSVLSVEANEATIDASNVQADDRGHLEERNGKDYLKSELTFQADRLLDQDKNGVMMSWETGIMRETAGRLAPSTGLRILNIGHGMGIIDGFFKEKSPSSHHIVEAHPAVLTQMRKNGWYDKPGVNIHEGKWQTIIPALIEKGLQFDAIYWDTFSEAYKDLHLFFSEYVIGLLDEGGKWGFFNGLGADRQICYDVYTKLLEIDALEMGYDVDWTVIPVPDLEKSQEWDGVKRPYWKLKEYKLPICTFIG